MDQRLIFAFLLVWGVCIASVASYECNSPTFGCAAEGASCVGDSIRPNGCNQSYDNSTCCAPGLYCIEGECETDNIGDNCTVSKDCFAPITAGRPTLCDNNECYLQYLPGDECDTSLDCIYSLNCSNNYCLGFPQGMSCELSPLACAQGLYCAFTNLTTATCQPVLAVGQPCVQGVNSCPTGSNCVNVNGTSTTCVPHYSVNAGDNCQHVDDCMNGYFCATWGNSTCQPVPDDFDDCDDSSDCTYGFTCLCSQFSGESYCVPSTPLFNNNTFANNSFYTMFPTQLACTEEASTLDQCLTNSNCSNTFFSDAENSCSYQNCYSEVKTYYSCGCDVSDDWFDSCAYNPYCGGFPTWAIIVIIVVAIVIVLAIVLLVFFMMKKRRDYDAII